MNSPKVPERGSHETRSLVWMPNGAVPVSGARGVHAEQKIQQAADAMNGRVTNVGTAPRNPCGPSQQNCQGMLDANGTSNSTPFR